MMLPRLSKLSAMPEMTPSDGLVWMIEVGMEMKHFRLELID